jgi:AcrR family transcriptional regulator
MPKQTFFNISEKRRNRILEVAVDEFSSKSYYEVSVNAIVKKADISKGSFYQYFDNKLDLFKYILTYLGDKKLEYINQTTAYHQQMDFFEYLRAIYIAGFKFALNNKKLFNISKSIFSNDDLKFEFVQLTRQRSQEYFKGIVDDGIANGSLDQAINKEIFINLIITLNFSLVDYYYEDLIAADDQAIESIVDDFIYLLKKGAGDSN